MNPKKVLVELLLDLAWSHWTTLGVAGVQPATDAAVDLEALMILTAELAPHDPRLRDEAFDWCARYHSFASKPRLKQLLEANTAAARAAFGGFARVLEEHVGGTWPGSKDGERWTVTSSGKSHPPNLERPALMNLRLRALFGVGARADVIMALLGSPSATVTASSLVYVGYTKRNLADTLDMLAAGGLLKSARVGNRVHFSWRRHREVTALVKPVPDVMPRWSSIFRLVSGFSNLLTRAEGKSERMSMVEAAKAFQQMKPDLDTLGIEPPIVVIGTTAWASIVEWMLDTTRSLATGRAPSKGRSFAV